MKSLRWRMMCTVVAVARGCLTGREATAQSLGGPPAWGHRLRATGRGAADWRELGQLDMPTPIFRLFTPTVPSAMADPTAAGIGIIVAEQHHEQSFRRAVHLQQHDAGGAARDVGHDVDLDASTGHDRHVDDHRSTTAAAGRGDGDEHAAQLGLLMLATQNNGGVGSGQMSGRAEFRHAERATADARRRPPNAGSAARPGGLASRYFNRTGAHTLIRRVTSTGKLATSRNPRLSRFLPVFDLSKRAIVPIVSPVKTDPADERVGLEDREPKRRGTGRVPGERDRRQSSPAGGSRSPPRVPVRPKSECREDVSDESHEK